MQRHYVLMALGLVAAALLAGAPLAYADTRYAEPNGNGPEPCTDSTDPCDIQNAVEGDTMPPMPGDQVVLLPGTYTLDPGGLFIGENISVGGQAGQPRPLITAPLFGIAIENNGSSTTPPALREVEIVHNGFDIGLANAGGLVERVTVTSTGSAPSAACSVYGRSDVDGLFRDSICRETGGGAAIRLSWGGPASTRGQLRNVTAVSPAPGGLGISLDASGNGAAEIDAVNTIARGALTDVRASDDASVGASATVTLARSNYATEDDSGSSTVTDPGTNGNQVAAPLFVNAAAGDLHQLPGSPTIDAGIADSLLGPLDFEGQPRVIGSAPDIGGDELLPVTPASQPVAPQTTRRKKCKKAKGKRGSASAKKKRCKKRKKGR